MHNNLGLWSLVIASLLLGLLLELLPLPATFADWRAPWLLVVVAFWGVHLPVVGGIGLAWMSGLLLDAACATPLGSHALVFTLASALTLAARRLLLAFSILQQALWVALLSMMQQGILSMMQQGILLLIAPMGSGAAQPFWQAGLSAALFWMLLHGLLYHWTQPRIAVD